MKKLTETVEQQMSQVESRLVSIVEEKTKSRSNVGPMEDDDGGSQKLAQNMRRAENEIIRAAMDEVKKMVQQVEAR